jgi:glycosyltransferase involved in cell wall biosynthesis
MAQRLLAAARTFQPDVLHVFKPVGPGALAGWRWDGPLVVDNDDWEGPGGWADVNPYAPLQRRILIWQERDMLSRAHAVTCASRVLVQRTHLLASESARTLLLPNGPLESWRDEADAGHAARAATRAALEWPSGAVIVAYTGNVERQHDLDILIRAIQELRANGRDVRALFVATGDGVADLRAQAASAGLDGAITWRGFTPHHALMQLLCAADIGAFPYRDTNINRAKCSGKVMDYMNAGLPTLSHDVGMMRHYVPDAECGLLAQPGDDRAFAANMLQLVESAPQRKALGAAARLRIWSEFGWQSRIGALEQLYTIVLRNTGKRP